MPHYIGTTDRSMKSIWLFSIDEVFAAMDSAVDNGTKVMLEGASGEVFNMRLSSDRIGLFKTKGTTCDRCGLSANLFSLESPVKGKPVAPHLNLYALIEDRFILFTKDHIIPRFYGGPNRMENYVPMCMPCNTRKGHSKPKKRAAKKVIAELTKNGYEFEEPITLTYP